MGSVEVEARDVTRSMDHDKMVRDLLRSYIRVVDDKDLETWTELFAEQSSYVVTTRENEERGLPLAFVYDDSKGRILDRVIYVTEVWKGHYNDYRQRHILSDFAVEWVDDSARVTASFAIYISEPSRAGSQLLAAGEYVDVIAIENGAAKFRSKKVILDGDVLPRYFVFPL